MSEPWDGSKRSFGTIDPEILMNTPGLELCHMMIAGEITAPPMGKMMNFGMTEANEGHVLFRGVPLADHRNPAGVIHGGWAATILDSALGCCVWTKVPVGFAYTTIEFKVNLVRPITADTGECVCEAQVLHMGRTVATCEGTLKTRDGKLLAHGTETCAIYKPRIPT